MLREADSNTDFDRVQLLLRNAKQMLKIVTATFADVASLFDESRVPKDVDQWRSQGDGGKLAHLWVQAKQALPDHDVASSDSSAAVEKLYMVRINNG